MAADGICRISVCTGSLGIITFKKEQQQSRTADQERSNCSGNNAVVNDDGSACSACRILHYFPL